MLFTHKEGSMGKKMKYENLRLALFPQSKSIKIVDGVR